LIWWYLAVYRVEEITKEKFVTNVVQVEMQRRHFYIFRHGIKVINATATYQAKHGILDTNMV
jgi:hypothetical protein